MGNRANKLPAEAIAPKPLSRPPRTDLVVKADELDRLTAAAVAGAAKLLLSVLDRSRSLPQVHLLMTKVHLLQAMETTHGSIRRLVWDEAEELALSLDSLPLARMQLERCFLALLIEDNPKRWHRRYQKNAWKAVAKKFFRDQRSVGRLPAYREHFGPNSPGISMLRSFARQMNVWEDELQTLRAQILGEEMDPRWPKRYIADMPTPMRAIGFLEDPLRKALAIILYPYYDSLSHASHSGLAGVMSGAILRGDAARDDDDRRRFWHRTVLETALPFSYVAILFTATLFACPHLTDEVRGALRQAWSPYHSDGSALGIALWDTWAGEALRTEG